MIAFSDRSQNDFGSTEPSSIALGILTPSTVLRRGGSGDSETDRALPMQLHRVGSVGAIYVHRSLAAGDGQSLEGPDGQWLPTVHVSGKQWKLVPTNCMMWYHERYLLDYCSRHEHGYIGAVGWLNVQWSKLSVESIYYLALKTGAMFRENASTSSRRRISTRFSGVRDLRLFCHPRRRRG